MTVEKFGKGGEKGTHTTGAWLLWKRNVGYHGAGKDADFTEHYVASFARGCFDVAVVVDRLWFEGFSE